MHDPLQIAWWILVALVVGTVIFVRIRLLAIPLERDEGEYAYAGQLLLRGIPPYQLAYNMKFPGAYGAYALFMALFGQSPSAIHLGLLIVNVATAVLLLVLARWLVRDLAAAGIAAAFFLVAAVSPAVLGLAAHVEHLVVLPVIAGTLLLLARERALTIFCGGVLFGIGVLMKQPAIFFAAAGAVIVIVRALRNGAASAARASVIFAAGVLSPIALTFALLWRCGVFDAFWFWTIDYARAYGAIMPLREGAQLAAASAKLFSIAVWPLCCVAAGGLILLPFARLTRDQVLSVLLFLFAAIAALSSGLYFRHHYYVYLLPIIGVLGAVLVVAARRRIVMQMLAAPVMAFALAQPLIANRELFFALDAKTACEKIYHGNIFAAAPQIGEFIRERMDPADTLAVMGSEPELYFYAQRHSASGFIYTYALMEDQPYARAMQQQMKREVELARPKFLIIVTVPMSWGIGSWSDLSLFDWMNEFALQHYQLMGAVNVSPAGPAEYCLPCDHQLDPWPASVLIAQRNPE